MSTVVATEDSLLFWGSRPLLRSTISCPASGNHSNGSSKDSTVIEPGTKKRAGSTSGSSIVSPRPALIQREAKSTSSVPDDLAEGDDRTPPLLRWKSFNDANGTLIAEGSQYGQVLINQLESGDLKRQTSNMELPANVNEQRKVFLAAHALQFCTEDGVMLDTAAYNILKLKVEGIACYGCNLLVLAEGQVAITPTSTTDLLDDPGTETTILPNDITAGGTSRTPFVMGRRLARESVFRRIDNSRYTVCSFTYITSCITFDRRGMQSPVTDSSRGNTPIPAVGPEFTPSPTSQPDQDSGSPDDSKVRITQCCMLNFHIKRFDECFCKSTAVAVRCRHGCSESFRLL